MIVWFSVGLPWRNVLRSKSCLLCMRLFRVRWLTGRKKPYFLARTQMCKLKRLLKWHLMFQPSSIMRSTWSCHLLLVETKRPVLHRLKKGSGVECKVGRKSSCLKLVRKWWSRRLSNLYRPTLWVFSSFRLVYVKILKLWFVSLGGVVVTRRISIG